MIPSANLSVGQVVAAYLDARTLSCKAGLITKQSLKKAEFYLRAFVGHYGPQTLAECRRGDVKRFLLLHPEYKSAHTKADASGQVVTCFRWAEEDGLIDRCPYTRPRDLPAPQPRTPITAEEVRRILASAKDHGHRLTRSRFRLALWFLWETGCRTCELYKLDWSMWDGERGCFTLDSKTTGKTGRKRILALPRRAWRLIGRMAFARTADADAQPMHALIAKDAQGCVFLNGRNRPWNKDTFGKLFRRHANAAGVRLEVSAYCLRHGFTCEALEGGTGERQLADYLGHASTKYVAWYGRGVRAKVDYLRAAGEKRGR